MHNKSITSLQVYSVCLFTKINNLESLKMSSFLLKASFFFSRYMKIIIKIENNLFKKFYRRNTLKKNRHKIDREKNKHPLNSIVTFFLTLRRRLGHFRGRQTRVRKIFGSFQSGWTLIWTQRRRQKWQCFVQAEFGVRKRLAC